MTDPIIDDHPTCHRCGEYLIYMWDAGYECSVCSEEAADRQNEIDRQEEANSNIVAVKAEIKRALLAALRARIEAILKPRDSSTPPSDSP